MSDTVQSATEFGEIVVAVGSVVRADTAELVDSAAAVVEVVVVGVLPALA